MSCSVCNRPLVGSYIVDYWGNNYCVTHRKLPRCYSCSRIICKGITLGGMMYRDRRQMCNLCRRTAVMVAADVGPIEMQVKKILGAVTLDLRHEFIPVRLVSCDEMEQAGHPQSEGLACSTRCQHGDQEFRSMDEILILYGLPAEHFAAILAHEYGHAWMWLNGYPDLPKPVKEGMCELFKWIWLKSQHTPEADFRLKLMEDNPDAVYGAGFRNAKVEFKKHHLLQLLEHVKTQRRFPF